VLKDSIGSTALIAAGFPLLIVAVLLGVMRWRRAAPQSATLGDARAP
jgi:hypothetical protein